MLKQDYVTLQPENNIFMMSLMEQSVVTGWTLSLSLISMWCQWAGRIINIDLFVFSACITSDKFFQTLDLYLRGHQKSHKMPMLKYESSVQKNANFIQKLSVSLTFWGFFYEATARS